MNRRLYCTLLAGTVFGLLTATRLPAQHRVRLAVLGDGEKPVPYLRLTLSGTATPVETESNGECWLTFPPGQTVLTVYPAEPYELVAPPDGRVFLPATPGQTLRVWVAPKVAKAQPGTSQAASDRAVRIAIDAAAAKERETGRLREQTAALRRQLDALEREHATSTARYDSIRAAWTAREAETARLQSEVAALRERIGLRRGELYAVISGELHVYVDRLKDLRDALPRAEDAFIDARIGQRFELTIDAYNAARDSLLRHHAGHTELAGQLWEPAAADALRGVYDKILGDTHQRLVLPLNDELISLFCGVRTGDVRPAAARKKAKKAGNEAFARLNAVLPLLERDVEAALRKFE